MKLTQTNILRNITHSTRQSIEFHEFKIKMDSSARRSGIPIPKSKSIGIKKNLSKSNDDLLSDSFNPSNESGELDVFTLLEENIALKEKIDELSTKHNTILQKNVQLERENGRVGKQFNDLKVQQAALKDQLQGLMDKFQKEIEDGQTIHNIQEQQKKIINDLMQKVRIQEDKHMELVKAGKLARNRLEELAPEIRMKSANDDATKCDIVTTETVEQLINEIGKIKTQMNNTELQLYEANEKIAELIESHHHMKEENENLKVENSNLTKVAKLMTRSMQESMDTNKKMEEALIEMKKRNDELVRGSSKDSIDSPTSTKFYSTNDQVMHLKEELKRREAAHTERIVEMNKLMETTIETNNNDEINVLRIKLEIVEKELQFAISRAETAETEVEQLKNLYRNSSEIGTSHKTTVKCSHCGNLFDGTMQSSMSTPSSSSTTSTSTQAITQICLPPPPPPPMPDFKIPVARYGASLKDGITTFTLNNPRESSDNASICSNPDVKKSSTGMDALIAQLRDGAVTLRRNRRKTPTNAALQEMFETLELSRKQNRNSRIVIESHRT
ncbi:paramyosin isoform X2 [Contarinia nasturtii]|uniref:paramyosin isoform X2 n=1 Tax=Contarinia nasturtii TaxID=265458 RepID=UPI0012D41CC6|nr:paramyosin isoform X2 [Contarinia nasturtii]